MNSTISTEEKIKKAAKKLFIQKGFAGTRTRDVAEEAQINLALLNYYYESKEKLFGIVMQECLIEFFKGLLHIANDESKGLEEKIILVVEYYTSALQRNHDLATFIFSQLQKGNPKQFIEQTQLPYQDFTSCSLYLQMEERLLLNGRKENPLHYLLNMLALTVFPFIAKPILNLFLDEQNIDKNDFMDDRKSLITGWLKDMLKLNLPLSTKPAGSKQPVTL